MVTLQTVQASNDRLKETAAGLVAVFLGATSGIGQNALRQFVERTVEPRVYIVARNATAISPFIEELRSKNPGGKYEVIEKDVSLVKNVDEVAAIVKAKETKLDLLFLSVGFFSFDGRQDTSEGLDASLTTRYYSRLRITQLLLPLLNASSSAHVMSVLAGGLEGPINEDDLSLSDPKNFSVSAGNSHSATMLTLSFEHLARENPTVSFVHAFPGLVSTPLLGRTSSGLIGTVLRWVVMPLLKLFVATPAEAGARALFHATSARYSVDGGLVPLLEGVEKATKSKGGVFLVDAKGESADNEKVLEDFRRRGVDKLVWEHTMEVFGSVQ
ncbi:NAD(P)-binding protein [Purpureocillium lilacinum]|uniref:NAD(P)-binding protein n=2 Tax=Purpureocillium lilacinum TaxID=33203 RepID=A0A179GCI2_PURLI|nr:NAD(P)-binding protein [Purpureocillium lilacinum]KAK4087956.1 hypothetical protein Purlil1_7714 [Purpureocillium lilacinum]OAQ75537.1 NAD(P)-binding protein [Purpureocillium lilacinum]OAQ81165.1 NAD(P)-binding protein [Purpureocillium lilacinum]GJN76103.1 hypothetical protein PLICBS_010215 [Purpureocillium lilacinum]